MGASYYVAWWNVENLFDEENAPPQRRPDKVKRAIQKDIKGWTPALRDRKIAQLASVIAQMNDSKGPDLLGVCEVENRFVLDRLVEAVHQLLPDRSYAVVHADTQDARGIDVAFLYETTLLTAGEVFFHVVMRRNATRDIVQVDFTTTAGTTLVAFGNHWPSRSGGQYESAGYRDIAGETLAYFHERVLEVLGPATPAIAMGDFNDEPFDTSLVTHALATRQHQKVEDAESPYFWNLMWPLVGAPDGSFYYEGVPNQLDQFLVNRNMIGNAAKITVEAGTAEILRFPHTFEGKFRSPRLFGGMGKKVVEDGYSDHFPVGLVITETG